MFAGLVRCLSGQARPRQAAQRKWFRPCLVRLEDRLAPANCTWVGNGAGNGALWNVAANWSTNSVPGANDVAIFSNAFGASNADCTMNLGGNGMYHVGKLVFKSGYNKTLTLSAHLVTDVLDMQSNAEVTGNKELRISQRTNDQILPAATMFGTSFWTQGTIQTSFFVVYGENAHRATLDIGDAQQPNLAVDLKCEMWVFDQYSTVNWVGGEVTVAAGKKVVNKGTFLADSPGKIMGNNGPAADKWTFENHKNLHLGKGDFKNEILDPKAGAKTFKVASAAPGGTDKFVLSGDYLCAEATAELTVESGTLTIQGSVTQSAGSITVDAGNELEVLGAFDLSGGSVAVNGELNATTLLDLASYEQSGGTLEVTYATLTATEDLEITGGTATLLYIEGGIDDQMLINGGTLALYNISDFTVTNGVSVGSGGILEFHSGTLVGNVTNAGTLRIGPGEDTAGDVYTIEGNYTQTSTGRLCMQTNAYATDFLTITGTATLDGIFELDFVDGYDPGMGGSWGFLSFGSRVGTFASYDLPDLGYGTWTPDYDSDSFGLNFSY